jgi:flagellum-specific peptidoglycan hydrolase FlgJ
MKKTNKPEDIAWTDSESVSNRKDLIFSIALCIGAFFILSLQNNSQQIEIEKFKEVKEEYIPDVYAGRTEKEDNTTYNSLGLPYNRDWLTRKEFQGKHIKDLKISEHEKKMLKIKFKVWKQTYIEEFVDRMCHAAIEEAKVYDEIAPELIVIQAVLESNYGLSKLACEANNIYGVKYRGKDESKFMIAADDSPTDKFTKYKSQWWSMRAYTKLLMRKYRKRIKGTPNLNKWLKALCGGLTLAESAKYVKNGGQIYATSCYKGSKCYSQKLLTGIETLNIKNRIKKIKNGIH